MASRKARRHALTRDDLFARSLAIIDRDGLEALTMRRLGAELGVEAASLYHHVADKDALLDGVLVVMRREMRIPDPVPPDWQDAMVAIFAEYRRVLSRHPNLVSLAGRRVEGDPNGLLALVALGFSHDDAVELWQSLIAFAIGYSLFSSAAALADNSGLPPALASRMAEWRDDTCSRSLRMLLASYDAARGAAARTQSPDAATRPPSRSP